MIRLRWKNTWIDYEKIEWSGTDVQCSRQITFSVAWNPYDRIEKNNIALGDLVYLYDGKKSIFLGQVTSREKKGTIGTAEYTAMDFMHHLLRSNGTYKFKNKTPEAITKILCKSLGIGVSKLATTRFNIAKVIYEDQCIYDIIVGVYKKAKAHTKKKYMPVMDGKRVSVIAKGKSSGVNLGQGYNVTDATYSDTLDNMVDKVVIYNEKRKKLGEVKNKKHISKYGTYQQAYTKEKGVNAKKSAKALLVGITKTATVTAVGNIKAISGRSIVLKDKATGLSGTFYITSDTHTFENNTHMMTLELSWVNSMGESAEETSTKKNKSGSKKKVINASKAYYLEDSKVYHSSKACPACKGKNLKTSTVQALKRIKITKGTNKGKRKYRACSKCWR